MIFQFDALVFVEALTTVNQMKPRKIIFVELLLEVNLDPTVHGRDRGVLLAVVTQFLRQSDSGICNRGSHRRDEPRPLN